ncbi:MAG: hypothetical protein JHC26_12805 [Thermofilum sp.]|uniref:hypothetical protein n=1 Tax=Thermofilum sp. TaxID=1961369 RepID=UPI00258A8754|nr:hypothetical protein [Thermofilum sp.]MCI4409966.1 hypothetical protein [Thermofilum sp.]
MSPKVLSVRKEENDAKIIIRREVLDEIFGHIDQELVLTKAKDRITSRTWFGSRLAMHYGETEIRRIKTRDGKDAIDVVWGSQGEGHSDWHWCIIVPFDPRQIDLLFDTVKDYETYWKIKSRLYSGCLSRNIDKRVECDLSFLFSE